jgi:hypothetical protein
MKQINILIIIFLAILLFFTSCFFQENKNSFRKIEIAYFKPDTGKNGIFISTYLTIGKSGLVNCFNEDKEDKLTEYTTIYLPKNKLQQIGNIIEGKQKLKTYQVTTKLDDDEFFAGEYFYLRVEYEDDKVDSVCTILPFLATTFTTMYDSFESYVFDRANGQQSSPFAISDLFLTSLKGAYRQCDYLPEITTLPPFKSKN